MWIMLHESVTVNNSPVKDLTIMDNHTIIQPLHRESVVDSLSLKLRAGGMPATTARLGPYYYGQSYSL